MHLWNDYEGATLAGQWTLGRLLRTEGRSALFSTTKPDGAPAVLRLTEALNDQAALQARYRSMKAAGDEFLVKVEGFGDAEWDGTPLSYAVLEPTQESLADILANRRLDTAELQEVANVVAGGLLALHRQGLVHGLVEPESVLAASDKIKLRSDCARPAPATPEDAQTEGAVTEKTDAWGLADIIHRSLTQAPLQSEADALALPEPYAAIVRQTARGAWGVSEIEAELKRFTRAAQPAPAAPVKAATVDVAPSSAPGGVSTRPVKTVPSGTTGQPSGTSGSRPSDPIPAGTRPVPAIPKPNAVSNNQPLAKELLPGRKDAPSALPTENVRGLADKHGFQRGAGEPLPSNRRTALLAVIAAVILIAILFAVFHQGSKPPVHAGTVPHVSAGTAAPANPRTVAVPTQPLAPAAAKPSPSQHSDTASASGGVRDIWRVVAYTYNKQSKAENKAAELNKKYPSFKAEAWSPTGSRPYLVTLGGPMPRTQATELRTLALQAGVSKDVYTQNYAH